MKILLISIFAFTLSIIYAPPSYAWLQNYEVSYYGFFSGIWHGLIAPFAVFAQLFDKNIILYSPINTGFGYNLGFLIGIGVILGGSTSTISKE